MLGIIGGSGLYSMESMGQVHRKRVKTQYDRKTVPAEIIEHETGRFAFLARHGKNHQIAPHEVNYRANIAALKQLGVTEIIAVNAVGGISDNTIPGAIIIPDQLIDYTWGRKSTYFDGEANEVHHIDFSHPFDAELSERLLGAVEQANSEELSRRMVMAQAVYGVTQGPRLETAAEINRMKKDGCDIVGMTGMPEAGLARELGLSYATIAVVVNWAAGKGNQTSISHDEMNHNIKSGMINIHKLLAETMSMLLES